MKRFLLCSFAPVLLYPAGIDMYLVGLPRIAADLNASEAQLHIAFSVYGRNGDGHAVCREDSRPVRPQAGRDRRRDRLYDGLTALFTGVGRLAISEWAFSSGVGAGGCYVVAFAILRDTLDEYRRAKVLSLLNGITCIVPVLAPVMGHLIMLRFPAKSVLYDVHDGHYGGPVITVYPARDAPGKAGSTRFITIVVRRRVAG